MIPLITLITFPQTIPQMFLGRPNETTVSESDDVPTAEGTSKSQAIQPGEPQPLPVTKQRGLYIRELEQDRMRSERADQE